MQDIFIKGIALLYAHINTIVVELDPRVENINIYARVKVIIVYHDAVNVCAFVIMITTLIISKKPGNTGISRDIRTEFTTDLLLSD